MTPSTANPVASFTAGIISVSGAPVGICIKFSYFDQTQGLTHWPLSQFALLCEALGQYVDTGNHDQFMFKTNADPALVHALPPRHPYHTLLNEVPPLTSEEIGSPTANTQVVSCLFSDHGPTFAIELTGRDGSAKKVFMHEYTAFSLYGYLQEYIKAFDELSGPAVGPIQ